MADTTAAPAASQERPEQRAVAPLNTIDKADIAAGAAIVDKWLYDVSGGYVTLERVQTVAGSLPVLGNILALVDVLGDLVSIYQKGDKVGFDDWFNLGTDLIGVIPGAGGPARMALRPALHALKKELPKILMNSAKAQVSDALVELLLKNINDSLVGEIETFAATAQTKLDAFAEDCAKLLDGLVDGLIEVLQLVTGDKQVAQPKPTAASGAAYKPEDRSLRGLFSHVMKIYREVAKEVVKSVAGLVLSDAIKGKVRGVIAGLRDIKSVCRAKLKELVSAGAEKGIMRLLKFLEAAAKKRRKKIDAKPTKQANTNPNDTAKVKEDRQGPKTETVAAQTNAKGDPNGCKNCPGPGAKTAPLPRTHRSISYITGAETVTHTDFVLPAPLPIVWDRTYRSNLGAYDHSALGARWLTPYSSRVDVIDGDQGLRHHGGDGRSHDYRWMKVGQQYFDPIEEVTLRRHSEALLILDFGKPLPDGADSPWREVYELVDTCSTKRATQGAKHYRLIAIHTTDGASIGLRYDHQGAGGEQVLSDIISRQGEEVLAHAGTQVDALGRICALWEINAGRLVRQLAAYQHDGAGDLVQARDEDGAPWQYQYSHHLLTRYTDRTGRGVTLEYDGTGVDAKAVHEWADDGSFDTRVEWDRKIRLTYVTDALGRETWYYYDILGYLYRIIYPTGTEEWFFRDEAKNVTQHLHADGSSDHYDYDEYGNLKTHERADGTEVRFEYDAAHRITRITDPEGGVWQRSYDERGHLVCEIDPRGMKTAYAYDDAGRPVHIVDAKGGGKRITYNLRGHLASYTDCSGRTSQWEYDDRGRLTASINALKQRTELRYTPVTAEALAGANNPKSTTNHPGQLQAVIYPDGTEARFCHDAEGRLLAHTDAMERSTSYRYGLTGFITQRIDANGHRLHYKWDKLGRLEELRNENGQPYTFAYDPAGRLMKECGFDGKTTEYRYEESSGVLTEVIEGQARTKLEFDVIGRLTRRQATAGGSEKVETFGYNGRGLLAEAANADAKLTFFYDKAGNLVREHQQYLREGQIAVWQHRYNELNQRVGTTRPGGHTLEWLTYGSGHVHGLVLDGHDIVGFERDALHREVHRQQGNGLQQSQSYDPVGRLMEQHVSKVAGALSSGPATSINRTYQYDRAGQLTGIMDSRRGQLEYRYDPVGRLLAATGALGHEVFAFDPASNILNPEQRGSRVMSNLLKEYAGTHYRYDDRGNMVHRLSNGEVSTFEWDAFNRMVKAITPQGTTTFAYDALGRRIAKHSTRGTTLFGWDGDTLAFESSDKRSVHYVHEAGSFVPLVQATRLGPIALTASASAKELMGAERRYDIDRDPLWNGEAEQPTQPRFTQEEIAFYQVDHLGTPQELTDHEGNVAWAAQYKAWGQAREAISDAARKAGIANPIRFQGQYCDEETGLHYSRYRYYDPHSGRFASKDPIGLIGGLNFQRYAPNPVQWIDPFGLTSVPAVMSLKAYKPVIPGQKYSDQTCTDQEREALHADLNEKKKIQKVQVPKKPPTDPIKRAKLCEQLRKREADLVALLAARQKMQDHCFASAAPKTADEQAQQTAHEVEYGNVYRAYQSTKADQAAMGL
jgi:RHS repeat-associated protein